MKEKIHRIARRCMQDTRSRIATMALVLAAGILSVSLYSFMAQGSAADTAAMAVDSHEPIMANVGIVGDDTVLGDYAGVSNSWPAELVSSEISQIQPQREGTIVEWRVRVGEKVSAGQILAKISAPPATPELIQMLAMQTESVTMARAEASIAEEYTSKEQARLGAMRDSIDNNAGVSEELTFTALQSLRVVADTKKQALRSFVERALSNHVLLITNFTDWKNVRYGGIGGEFGMINQNVRNSYETVLIGLVASLQRTGDVPIAAATDYFDLMVRLANNSVGEMSGELKTMASTDQKEFLDMIAEYQDAQMAIADKETEYKLMIKEQLSMLEKDRSMAKVQAAAAEASYKTVSGEITGGVYIRAPRSGSISAIYKKVGELVGPEMSVGIVAGNSTKKLVVRMRIPSNVRKPAVGDIVSVVRPGFPKDVHKATMSGIGSSLDETGSYMADAVLLELVDWPVDSSLRVIPLDDAMTTTVPLSSVWWDEDGNPHVWGVSDAGRIFAKKVTLGRTLGTFIEIYEGLMNGDKYVVRQDAKMQEDTLLQDVSEDTGIGGNEPVSGSEHPGMEM